VKAKEIRITASRTFNLGNMQSFRVEAGLTLEIEEGDTIEGVRQRLLEELRKSLSDTYRAFHPRNRKNENRQLSR
jgi:hypothetical protein